jgi:hypothetical protein
MPRGVDDTFGSNPQYGRNAGAYTDGVSEGGIDIVITKQLSAAAIGDTDIVLDYAIRVFDAMVMLKGAGVASTTITVKSTANAITDAMAASGTDKAIVRATTIDDAYQDIPAGGILRITSATGATQPACQVLIFAHRR